MWNWSAAVLGVAYTVPAVVAMPFDVLNGLALAFGVLPAAVVGLAPSRRQRIRVVLLGACMGVPIWFGSLLSGQPWLAVPAIWLLAIGAAVISTRSPIGPIVLNMSVAMVGIGLSLDAQKGAALDGLIVAGSVFAWGVSLLWPERPPEPSPCSTVGADLDAGLRDPHSAPPAPPPPPSGSPSTSTTSVGHARRRSW